MKQEDFERLKKLCQDNDFEIDGVMNNEGVYFIKKKDPWDDVEFFLGADGIIRKIPDEETLNILKKVKLLEATPSTEAAYIDQLKKEVRDKFGIIEAGQRFRFDKNDGIDRCPNGILRFKYIRESDSLYLENIKLYQQGRWATRVKDKVRVELLKINSEKYNSNTTKHSLKFLVSEEIVLSVETGNFLTKQLEEYLNKE